MQVSNGQTCNRCNSVVMFCWRLSKHFALDVEIWNGKKSSMTVSIYQNNTVSAGGSHFSEACQSLAFHRRLPGYAPTPLVNAPLLATRLGVGKIWIKDETHRFGMPSFKILGTSWALYRALVERLGAEVEPWNAFQELASRFAPLRPLTLVTATDGNHGRAVAHLAALFGFEAHIFVPCDMAESRINAIKQEGAMVTLVNGSYDDAVKHAATLEGERSLVLSDTSWPGYERIPQWVIEGYATMLQEVDEELSRWQQHGPDLVVVQIGVGALAAAVAHHYRRPAVPSQVKIVGIEPTSAACALASMKAGQIVSLTDAPQSIMAGLNCGTPSLIAWPLISTGIDLFVAIEDKWAKLGMRDLAKVGLVAGETGAAGIGGLAALLAGPSSQTMSGALGIDRSTRVLVICTEGATDPVAYEHIVGKSPR
jgi:diaminopropionate ammonia-lyase